MRLFKTAIALIVTTLLLTGCSSTLVYNRLDWLIPWYVDGWVDISREQRQLLRQQLEPRLQWHREEELVRYIEILDRVEADLAGPIEPAQVRRWVDEILAAAERVERSMMGVALEFGATISDQQMDEFLQTLWEQQEEYEEEFLSRSDADYFDDDFDTLSDFLKRFLGRLSPAQQDILRAASRSLQRFDKAWLEERHQWLDTLEPLMQREEGWQQAVSAAYDARQKNRTPEYHATFEHNLDVITRAIAEVINQASERQQRRAVEEIEDIRGKVEKLIQSRKAQDQAAAGREAHRSTA